MADNDPLLIREAAVTHSLPPRDSSAVFAAAVVMIAVGVVIRYLRLPAVEMSPEKGLGEAYNVAKAFARTGAIADAFATGQGPTAHLMPLAPIIGGTVYRIFGIHTPTSGVILTTIALGFVFTSFWLLFLAFQELGSPVASRLLALAIVCLSPINVMLEDVWFRVWDGGMAVAAGALTLYLVLRFDRRLIGTREIVILALVVALTLFIAPPFGVAGYCCAALLMVRRLPPRRWLATMGIAAVALAAVLTPWTLRNMAVMGSPIALRDNFGLELRQANDSSLLTSPDPDGGIRRRHEAVHPWASRAAYAKMVAAGGEVAYSNSLKSEAYAWIAAHPLDFLTLTSRHLRILAFPPLTTLGEPLWHGGAWLHRFLILRIVATLGFAGIGYALLRLGRRYHYAVIMTLVTILPYLVVEVNLRYRYNIFALLAFFAGDFVVRIVRMAWQLGRRRVPGPATAVAG